MKICMAPGCDQQAQVRKCCNKHYRRLMRHGTTDSPVRHHVCITEGCEKRAVGKGLCMTHYQRIRRARLREEASA